MFPHRVLIHGHTFDLLGEGQVLGRALWSRGDLRGDHGSGSVSELTGGLLQPLPHGLIVFQVHHCWERPRIRIRVGKPKWADPGCWFVGRESWATKEKLWLSVSEKPRQPDPICWFVRTDQQLVTQHAFEPLAHHDWREKWFVIIMIIIIITIIMMIIVIICSRIAMSNAWPGKLWRWWWWWRWWNDDEWCNMMHAWLCYWL